MRLIFRCGLYLDNDLNIANTQRLTKSKSLKVKDVDDEAPETWNHGMVWVKRDLRNHTSSSFNILPGPQKPSTRPVPCHVETNAVLGKCVIIPLKGRRVEDSAVLPGLLIEVSEIQLGKPLAVKRTGSNMIKLALFSVSMSGDGFNPEEGTIAFHHGVSLEVSELNQLLNVGKQLVKDEVGLVVCQKVMHPSLKQYLKENGVMAVDRAGLCLMEPLGRMTGAPSVSKWSDFLVSKCGCGMNGNTENLSWRFLQGQSGSSVIQGCPKEPSVKVSDLLTLDCFAAKCAGLQVAVETANLILDLSYIIEDQN
ncbi:hypothetical protein TURU_023436 [Turdus rufiventris]|nr:hypothetical protein TURU_023436 [Turdus rufiventris]